MFPKERQILIDKFILSMEVDRLHLIIE